MAGQYGQFTGYEPLPEVPGAYNFQLANGGQRTFVGPEAEALRAKIDAVPDQRTAEFKPGDALAAFGGGRGAPPPTATDAGGAYRPGAGPMAAPVAPGGGPAQAAGPDNEWVPYKTGANGNQILLRKGGDPANRLDLREIVPGRAASKGGLALRNVASQGGYALDPGRLADLDESQAEIQAAARHSAVEAQKAAAERQQFFTAARQQASSEVVQAARENSLREQGVADMRARYDAAEKDFLAAPEKQKAAREGKKGQTFVEAIAMSLGAFGAAMARTPNFAAQTIEANRERELRREEAELRVKKDAKDSLYGRLRDEMGSAELAKTAWRAIRTKQDLLAMEQIAAKSSDLKQQQEILQVAGVQNQGYLKYMESLERGAQGEISKQFVNNPGSAGSAGGVRSVRDTDVDKRDLNAPGAKPAEALPIVASREIADAAAVTALGNKILTNPALAGAEGEFWGPGGSIKRRLPGGELISSADENRLQQDMQQYLNVRIKQMTGAGMNESEATRLAKAEVGSGSANDVKRGVANGTLNSVRTARAHLATQDPRNKEALLKTMDPYSRSMIERGQPK